MLEILKTVVDRSDNPPVEKDLKRLAGFYPPVGCPQVIVAAMTARNRGDNRRGLNG
jgi:hypothetical protein